jgi:hypothetical protein
LVVALHSPSRARVLSLLLIQFFLLSINARPLKFQKSRRGRALSLLLFQEKETNLNNKSKRRKARAQRGKVNASVDFFFYLSLSRSFIFAGARAKSLGKALKILTFCVASQSRFFSKNIDKID